jgi:hypothetical protein
MADCEVKFVNFDDLANMADRGIKFDREIKLVDFDDLLKMKGEIESNLVKLDDIANLADCEIRFVKFVKPEDLDEEDFEEWNYREDDGCNESQPTRNGSADSADWD